MNAIVVVAPVLNRPERAAQLARSLRDSRADARLLFMCSLGDDQEIDACRATGASVMVVPWAPARGDWARKINRAYRLTREPWLLLAADDLHFHPGWDVEALTVAAATGAGVIGTNDLGNVHVMKGDLATHALIRRTYVEEHGTIDEPGKILHEGYWHNWVDAELTETAKARGQFAYAPLAVVEHLHPSWGKAPIDDTYERGLSMFREDARLLGSRRRLWRGMRVRAREDRMAARRGARSRFAP